jgi:hypothetical protein
MKLRWLIPVAFLIPLRSVALDGNTTGKVVTLTIRPGAITQLHLRAEFESMIHMPDEVTSVIVGSPGSFKAEHGEGEPDYVYVKPIVRIPAQSDLLITTRSGQHVVLELVSDGAGSGSAQPIDFLVEYRAPESFIVAGQASAMSSPEHAVTAAALPDAPLSPRHSAIDEELSQQNMVNAPDWTRWDGQQIGTSIGDIRQLGNQTLIGYSVFNPSDHPVEILPPQIQITGLKPGKKKKNKKGILADQLEIRDYKLTATRLEPGGRADGVVLFDRPNFKQSTEKLFLQIAQANQIDRPILIAIPFTPPIAVNRR